MLESLAIIGWDTIRGCVIDEHRQQAAERSGCNWMGERVNPAYGVTRLCKSEKTWALKCDIVWERYIASSSSSQRKHSRSHLHLNHLLIPLVTFLWAANTIDHSSILKLDNHVVALNTGSREAKRCLEGGNGDEFKIRWAFSYRFSSNQESFIRFLC